MADMRTRDALALAFSGGPASRPPERVMDAARRLERGLVWRRIGLRLQRAAAVAFLVGAGWLAHAQVGLFEISDSEACAQAARLCRGRPSLRIRRRSSAPAWSPSTRGRTTIQPRSGPRPASPCPPAGRLARRRRPGVSLALWPQRRACSRSRRAWAHVPVRGPLALLRRDRAHPGAFCHGHHRLLAVGRTCLRAHRLRSRGSDRASRSQPQRKPSLIPSTLHARGLNR